MVHGSWLMAHGSRLTAHGSRLTAHGSRLTAHDTIRYFLHHAPSSFLLGARSSEQSKYDSFSELALHLEVTASFIQARGVSYIACRVFQAWSPAHKGKMLLLRLTSVSILFLLKLRKDECFELPPNTHTSLSRVPTSIRSVIDLFLKATG
jgi:hypothetical protein